MFEAYVTLHFITLHCIFIPYIKSIHYHQNYQYHCADCDGLNLHWVSFAYPLKPDQPVDFDNLTFAVHIAVDIVYTIDI